MGRLSPLFAALALSLATGCGDDAWDYALGAHEEMARDGGRVEILSYTRPAGFLTREMRLLELLLP